MTCSARNSSSLMIQLSGDQFSHILFQCNVNDSKNQPIINMIFLNNTGDGTSLLECTIPLKSEQWNRNETSSINVSCLNTEIGVQASKTFQFPGKCVNDKLIQFSVEVIYVNTVNLNNCESTTISTNYPLVTATTDSRAMKLHISRLYS